MEPGPGDCRNLQGGSEQTNTQTGGFRKRRGFATTSGQDYEVALCCLFFLRSLRLASDFFLVSNHALAGKFDDVVLLYRPRADQSLEYRAILLQAKHRENVTKKKLTASNPFSMKDYLDSFREIENLWREPVNVEGQLIEFQEISLALYTNTGCVTGDVAREVTDSPGVEHLRDILDTGGRLLRICDPRRVGLPRGPETSDFINHLILCTDQTSVEATDQLLEKEISKVLRLTSLTDAKELVQELKHVVRSWWREEGEGRCLSAQCDEWKRVVELQVTRLNTLQSQLNLDFTAAALEELRSLVAYKQSWISVRDEDQGTATRVRLLKALRTCLVLDAVRFLESRLDEVEALWGTAACPCLALDVSAGPHSQLLQRLLNALGGEAGRTRTLVVVARGEPPAAEWSVLEAEGTWSILDAAIQQRLLAAQVDLQGKVVALCDVIGSEASPIMSDKFIRSLCSGPAGGVVKLGATISPPLEYYVPRCMERMFLKRFKFNEWKNTNTIIFPRNLFGSKHSRFKILHSDLIRINRIVGTTIVERVHFDSEVRRQCCRLSARGIRGFFYNEGMESDVTEFIPLTWLCEEKVVVLEGPPGIGKSSFVTAMCSRVKERFPGSWVLRMDMGKLSEFIDERDFKETSDITAFLLKGLLKDLLQYEEQELLQHALYVTGNVFLFLDAFDEISPDFTPKCCQLLKGIASSVRYRQMVVTTRPVTSKVVQEALGTKAFNLPVFSEDEQRLFLERFCNSKKECVDEVAICALFQSVGTVLEIPLLCRMAAEVLLHRDDQILLKYKDPWKRVLLYQLFVEQSISNRLAEKLGLELSMPGVKRLLESSAKEHLHNLQSLAVRKLMASIQLSSARVSGGLPDEKLGLVVNNGRSVDFDHKTFAEYFLGRWLACHWLQCPPQLLLDVLSRDGDGFVAATLSWSLLEGLPLHEAVAQGDEAQVRALLSSGRAADRDGGGRSALHVAAITQGKQHAVLDLLLAAGQDPNSRDDDMLGSSAIMYAQMFRNWEFLDVVLQKGMRLERIFSDVNDAENALIEIMKLDLPSLLQFILRQHEGVSHQRFDGHGNTLLHMAAANNNTRAVKRLIEMRHHVNLENYEGETPLYEAALFGHEETVKLLLQHGADPNVESQSYRTPLMQAARLDHLEVVRVLLKEGVDANVNSENGGTALISAAERGHLEVVRLLVKNGADLSLSCGVGSTALMFAAEEGHLGVVELLAEKGADPNERTEHGNTALTMASGQGHLEVVKLLRERGADPRVITKDNNTALMYAAHAGHLEVAEFLIERKVDPNARNNYGYTALMLAADKGHLEVVKLLVEKGADLNNRGEEHGHSALTLVCDKGHLEVLKVLLEKGADTNLLTEDGRTALMLAADEGHLEVVKLLLEKGADPNIRAQDGRTALTLASDKGHPEIVKLLIERRRK